MDLSSLIDDNPLSSAQVVGTADALLTDATDTILRAKDPVLATTQAANGDATSPIDGFVPLVDEAVHDAQQGASALADPNGAGGSAQGLAGVGQAAGLGDIGGANVVGDLLGASSGLTGGDTPAIGHILSDGLPLAGALGGLGSGAAQDAGANPGLLGPLGDILPETQALSAQPIEQLANTAVLDVHNLLETIGHELGLADGLHGLTNFGETVGLGKIGDANLVTDVLDTPSALLAGDLTPVMHIPADLGNIGGAAQTLVSDLALDAANANAILTDPVGHIQSVIPTLEAFPATALANEAIDTVHGILETLLEPIAPGTIHGVIGTGNALGLGELGGQNALTDVLNTPTSLLSGDTTPLTHLPGDLGQVGTAVGSIFNGIGADLSGSPLLGALTHPATGGGLLGGSLPGQGVAGTATGLVEGAVNGLGDATGLGGITHAITGAAGDTTGGPSSPLTGLLQLPDAILGGASNGAAPLPGDGGVSLGSLGSAVGAIAGEVSNLGGGSSPLAPVTGVLSGGTGGVLGDGTSGVLGTVTGALGGATGSGSGSHDLLTATVGPQTPTSGLGINVLDTSSSGQTHLVDTSVGTAAAPTPTIGTIALLADSIQLPTAASGGSDVLSGVLQSATGSGASASGGASASAGIDLGLVHIDAPIAAAHADPLGALGLAAHHA